MALSGLATAEARAEAGASVSACLLEGRHEPGGLQREDLVRDAPANSAVVGEDDDENQRVAAAPLKRCR